MMWSLAVGSWRLNINEIMIWKILGVPLLIVRFEFAVLLLERSKMVYRSLRQAKNTISHLTGGSSISRQWPSKILCFILCTQRSTIVLWQPDFSRFCCTNMCQHVRLTSRTTRPAGPGPLAPAIPPIDLYDHRSSEPYHTCTEPDNRDGMI